MSSLQGLDEDIVVHEVTKELNPNSPSTPNNYFTTTSSLSSVVPHVTHENVETVFM